ncbi:hypothetical protein [Pseudohaliea sp.]|uniref:hypothetical protein n=1 Tax=Pseudohaliea sp. TaxID=2740289 RepID=UPI0032EC3B24
MAKTKIRAKNGRPAARARRPSHSGRTVITIAGWDDQLAPENPEHSPPTSFIGDEISEEDAALVIRSTNSAGQQVLCESKLDQVRECLMRLSCEVRRMQEVEAHDHTVTSNPGAQREYFDDLLDSAATIKEILTEMGDASQAKLYEHGAFRTYQGDRDAKALPHLLERIEQLELAAKSARAELAGQRPRKNHVRDWAILELAAIYRELGGRLKRVQSQTEHPFERFARVAMPLIGLQEVGKNPIREVVNNAIDK